MSKVVILGCGYTGKALARRLIERGDPVRATTTTETKLSNLTALGAEPVLLDPIRPQTYERALKDAKAVVHLAPPSKREEIRAEVDRIRSACGPGLEAYVYGSTTGAFGHRNDPDEWIDETTPPRSLGEQGQARLDYERALGEAGLPLRVVRIAGIYGPGRTLYDSIRKESIILFDGAPPTSRIHVEDLARILEAMLAVGAPPMILACDERPATTLDVARYTSSLTGLVVPEPVSMEDAKRLLSPAAFEMRSSGRRCRSLVREKLIGALLYPTYIEGVRASLVAEGRLD